MFHKLFFQWVFIAMLLNFTALHLMGQTLGVLAEKEF